MITFLFINHYIIVNYFFLNFLSQTLVFLAFYWQSLEGIELRNFGRQWQGAKSVVDELSLGGLYFKKFDLTCYQRLSSPGNKYPM